MLRLAKDFYITKIEKRFNSRRYPTTEYVYHFGYKNYALELSVEFKQVGVTEEDNIAIVNFGYRLEIEKWSNRIQSFEYIYDIDTQDGKSTKIYFDSEEAREIVLKFVERSIKKHLSFSKHAIIIRGGLNGIKLSLPRYRRLDKYFFEFGYIKKEFPIDKVKALYSISGNNRDENNNVLWVYCKKEWYFKQLNDIL